MAAIQVRAASEDDIPALERIMRETFLADQTRYIPEAVDPASIAAFTADLVSRRWRAMALAELGGEPVGALYAEGNKIEAVNVLPSHQRRGVGTALMDWIEPHLRDAGFADVSLDTQEANLPARAFYEGRGYVDIRRWLQKAFTKTPIPTVTMAMAFRKAAG